MAAKGKNVPAEQRCDIEAMAAEYRAGNSLRQIAVKHGVTPPTVVRLAKKYEWTRDLGDRVRDEIKRKLNTGVVPGDRKAETEAIEKAAQRGVEVIETQRGDIAKLREREEALLKELGNSPTKLYITQYQGQIVQKTVALTVSERAATLRDLSTVQQRRIELERQAYNLDDADRLSKKKLIILDDDE